MARLEIEITSKGIQNTTKDIKSLENSLGSMQKRYQDAQQIVGGLSRQQMQLQKSMNDLKSSFTSGAMSAELYEKEMSSLSNEYSVAAGKIQEYQSQMSSLKATIDQLSNGTRSLGNAQKNLQAYSNDFTGGMRSSNAIAVEFSRVIQDMPYGMQGIGNNLQQLTQNFAYYAQSARAAAAAQGKTVSAFSIMRGALGGLASPINLLTLGVSALTAGWVLYEKWQQRANKAVKEGSQAARDYAENLNLISKALYEASTSYGNELARLNTLITVTKESNSTVEVRKNALKELQSMYPKVFQNFDIETIKTKEAAVAYKQLAQSIIAKARASAAEADIAKKSSQQFALSEEIEDLEKAAKIEQDIIDKQREFIKNQSAMGSAGTGASSAAFADIMARAEERRNPILAKILEKQLEISKLQENINDLSEVAVSNQQAVNTELFETVDEVKAVKDETDKYVSALEKLRSMRLDLGVNISDNDKEEAKVKRTFRKLFEGANEELANALSVKPNDTKAIEEYWATVRQISLARSKEIEIARKKDKEKAMGDIAQIELNYEKRSTQSITQMITNKLNNQYKAEVKALNKLHKERLSSEKEVLEDQKRLQERYWKDIADLDVLENVSNVGFLGLKDAIAEADEQFQKFISGLTDLSEIERAVKLWERFKAALKLEKKLDMIEGIRQVSEEMAGLVSEFGQLDGNIGRTILTLSKVINVVQQAVAKVSDLLATTGEALAKNSGGNAIVAIVGAVLSIVGSVWSILDDIAKKRKENHERQVREHQEFYRGLEDGERNYQKMLRERRIDEAYGSGGYDGTKKALEEARKNLPEIQKTYDKLFGNIQSSTYLAGKEVEKITYSTTKFHKIFGLIDPLWKAITAGAKRTKTEFRDVYETLMGADYDKLEELYEKGQLTGDTKKDFEELKKLREEIIATGKSIEQLEAELDQMLTGTTVEQLASGIVDMFRQGKTSAKDFADFTKEVIRNAMVSSFIAKYAMKYIEPFFDELSNQMDTGVFDYSKLEDLATKGIGQIGSGLEVIEKALGIKLFDPLAQAGRGIAGEIGRAITEESATRIEGIWRGIYDIDRRLLDVQTQALSYLGGITGGFNREEITVQINLMSEIAANTLRAAENTDVLPPMLEAMEEVVLGIGAIAKNTKQQSGRDLGV